MCQTASVLRNQVKERRDRNKSQGGPPPPPRVGQPEAGWGPTEDTAAVQGGAQAHMTCVPWTGGLTPVLWRCLALRAAPRGMCHPEA